MKVSLLPFKKKYKFYFCDRHLLLFPSIFKHFHKINYRTRNYNCSTQLVQFTHQLILLSVHGTLSIHWDTHISNASNGTLFSSLFTMEL